MIEIWMKYHLVSDSNCNIVDELNLKLTWLKKTISINVFFPP